MKYRTLGQTDLKASCICLGTMQFGWTASEEASYQVLDAFFEAGGNFIDTANMYSSWTPKSYGGRAEEIIGQWMARRKNRDKIVLATKVRGKMWEGSDGEGLHRDHILPALEGSLQRLKTDHVDLYQTHWSDSDVPHEDTLQTLDDVMRQGKVRHVGCSNYSAKELGESLRASKKKGVIRFESHQPYYNLIDREDFEQELLGLCQNEGIGIIPYSPIAQGFLTGKYDRRKPPPDSDRAKGVKEKFWTDRAFKILDQVREEAASLSTSPTAVALAWLLANPVITAPIIGANTPNQLQASLDAAELNLPKDKKAALDRVSAWQ